MAQVFPAKANTISRLSLLGGVVLLGVIGLGFWLVPRSSYVTEVGVPLPQPVPFSHKHHVGDDGIDCRYCHTSVEESAFAGIPPTKTCMNCHRQIWADSPMLAPVRDSFKNGTPLEWTRVHNLPGYVYFNHSIHVKKGVGCETCHGRIDQMPGIYQANTLQMEWCLDCHRAPEKFVRPREAVTVMGYKPPVSQAEIGARLVEQYQIQKLDSCSVCHR